MDHHDSHCAQDETYHTDPQAPFRRTAAKAKLRSVVLFESSDNLKMTVVRFGETALHAHIRIE